MQAPTLLPPPAPSPGGGVRVAPAGAGRVPLPEFLAGDIILFAGRDDFLSNGVRWFERSRGEAPTYAVHSAQFLDPARYLELDWVEKIRATGDLLKQRQAHDVWQRRGFAVWRCRALTAAQRAALTQQALAYVGARVAIAKFLTHELDGLINKVTTKEVFLFRRLNHDQRYPICSWVTAFTYDRVVHYQFGVPPECANPDQIDDWVRTHPDEWVRVFRLEDYS